MHLWRSHAASQRTLGGIPDLSAQCWRAWAKTRVSSCLEIQKSFMPGESTWEGSPSDVGHSGCEGPPTIQMLLFGQELAWRQQLPSGKLKGLSIVEVTHQAAPGKSSKFLQPMRVTSFLAYLHLEPFVSLIHWVGHPSGLGLSPNSSHGLDSGSWSSSSSVGGMAVAAIVMWQLWGSCSRGSQGVGSIIPLIGNIPS